MCIKFSVYPAFHLRIVMQVFSKWHNQKKDAVHKQQEEAIAERKRKGILSGREIFAQVRPCDACCHLLATACMLVWLILTKLHTALCPDRVSVETNVLVFGHTCMLALT